MRLTGVQSPPHRGRVSARILQAQDEERRRIALELQDSTGQMLTAIIMTLSTGLRLAAAGEPHRAISKSLRMAREALRQIRTLSYLLHPPLLDTAGLASALREYVDGFAQRSGISVELKFPNAFRRLSNEMELTIFRIVQEALTNVHRYSGAKKATLELTQSATEVVVQIEDQGRGLLQDTEPGVGIRGMEERARHLGGWFRVDIVRPHGTRVTAGFPLASVPSKLLASRPESLKQ